MITDRIWSIVAIAGFVYFILVGGSPLGDFIPQLRTANGVLAAAVLVPYFVLAPGQSDRFDRAMLLGAILFAAAGVLSLFPRQSFDAVLGALAYVAALFLMRGLVADERGGRLLMTTLRMLSLILTLLFACIWLPQAATWLDATGNLPLALNYRGLWWGHRYDVALILLMLYPSWWVGRPDPVRAAVAIVIGALTVLIVLLSGSRTLWLAAAVASGVMAAPQALGAVRAHPRLIRFGVGLALIAALALALSGFGAVLAGRLLTSSTVTARFDMWAILSAAWLDHPLGGFGPGSFGWILQATDYFNSNSWAPRHPDSSVFQLVAEAGLLGIAAGIIWAGVVAAAAFRSRHKPARWAIVTFGVAALGTSATDFGFLVVVVLAWIAYATPRARQMPSRRLVPTRRAAVRVLLGAAAATVAVAYVSMSVAMYSYARAASLISRGSFDEARSSLDMAISLDPGMALYWRQRGTLKLVQGDSKDALHDLNTAIDMNPYDDLAWRILATNYVKRGDLAAAHAAVDTAIDLQRADPENLLLSMWIAAADNEPREAQETLVAVTQSWPAVVGAPMWRESVPEVTSSINIVEGALERWEAGAPSPQPLLDQVLWLSAFTGSDNSWLGQDPSALGPELAAGTSAVLRCQPNAGTLLDRIPSQDRQSPTFWALKVRHAEDPGEIDRALALYDSISSEALDPLMRAETLNPINEEAAGGHSDLWGYRTVSVRWPSIGIELPSPDWGYLLWIRDPAAAIREAGLEVELSNCLVR